MRVARIDAADETVLFDVGPIALAHAEVPTSDVALEYVREAIHGALDAVVPYTGVLGAHYVLRNVYSMSTGRATDRLRNFLEARGVRWFGWPGAERCRSALRLAAEYNLDAWDGYYAHVARKTGAETVLTLDDDFDRVDGLTARVILSDDEFERLARFIENHES